MTVVPFLIIAAAAGTASLLVRARRGWSTTIAALGLIGLSASASAMSGNAAVSIGGVTLAGSDWLRLFALLGSVVGLLLVLVDVTASHEPDVPGVIVLGLGAAVLALAVTDPGIAVVAATTGGLAGVLVAAPVGAAARAAWVGIRELRALAVAGALAILATAWLARPLGDLISQPAVFGLAYLAFALAVAIRFGAVPFHRWAARVADAAPGAALPLLMAWGPAAFAAVALVWIDQSVAAVNPPISTETGLIAAIGAIGVVLGLVAAVIQDDLEHVVGYSIGADAGFVVLALAGLDPAVWEPSRTWLLVFVATRSAFAAWAVALDGAFGTRRLPELAGWARRAPVLAVALAGVGLATIGWPGMSAWDVRETIAGLTLAEPIAALVTIAPLLSLAIYGRILWVGLRPVGTAVSNGLGERPGWPAPWPHRPMVGLSDVERAFERASHAIGGGLDLLWALPAAARRNRTGIASLAVLVLAALALNVSSGGMGVPAAARALPTIGEPGPGPETTQPSGEPGSSPTVTFRPIDDGSPGASGQD